MIDGAITIGWWLAVPGILIWFYLKWRRQEIICQRLRKELTEEERRKIHDALKKHRERMRANAEEHIAKARQRIAEEVRKRHKLKSGAMEEEDKTNQKEKT